MAIEATGMGRGARCSTGTFNYCDQHSLAHPGVSRMAQIRQPEGTPFGA